MEATINLTESEILTLSDILTLQKAAYFENLKRFNCDENYLEKELENYHKLVDKIWNSKSKLSD
jgi:hypothetical protein